MQLAPSLKRKVVDNPIWLAPEAIRGENQTEMLDIYAMGVIMWEIFTREDYFGDVKWLSQIEQGGLWSVGLYSFYYMCFFFNINYLKL